MAKRKVKIEKIVPEVPKEKSFKYNGIIIPREFNLTRAKFDRMFKGKIDFDLDKFWKDYKAWYEANK